MNRIKLCNGCYAQQCEPAALNEIINGMWSDVFEDINGVSYYNMPRDRFDDAKKIILSFRNHESHERWGIFNKKGEAIGWSIGEMRDAETYYMRNSGIVPEFQRQGIYTSFLTQFCKHLFAKGYERIISHHQVNNNSVIIAKLKTGFIINGIDIDERFGLMTQLVRFKHSDRREVFQSMFSLGNQKETNA